MMLTTRHENHSNNEKGLVNKKVTTSYILKSNYVSIPEYRLYTRCSNNGKFKDTCAISSKHFKKILNMLKILLNLVLH